MKSKLYMLPGLGADSRLYERLRPSRFEVVPLNWLPVDDAETTVSYARRLAGLVDTSQRFYLGGVSLGGMLAIEMARYLNPERLLLISTVKCRAEMPRSLRLIKSLELHKRISKSHLVRLAGWADTLLLSRNAKDRELFLAMLRDCPETFLKFGSECALSWANDVAPQKALHIHGTADLVFPFSLVQHAVPVEKGSHFMVVERGEEIARLIDERL